MSDEKPAARTGSGVGIPPQVASWLRAHLRMRPGGVVATVGAQPWVAAVVGSGDSAAVEVTTWWHPAAGATGVAAAARVVAATEGIPLRSASLDAAVLGPFLRSGSAPAAVREATRAVRAGGRVVVVRNTCDTSVDWVRRARSVVATAGDGRRWDAGRGAVVEALGAAAGLGPVAVDTVVYHRECDVDEAVERFVAASRVGVLPPDQQGVALDSLRDLLSAHPDTRARRRLVVPYRVEAHWCERVADGP